MSDLASQLIAENKRTKASSLDLGNCGLTELPAELGELVWLEFLSLADEWPEFQCREWHHKTSTNHGSSNRHLKTIGPLSKLARLRSIYLSRAPVADLAPLANLSALQFLDLWDTHVVDLSPLTRLSDLQYLNISGTRTWSICRP